MEKKRMVFESFCLFLHQTQDYLDLMMVKRDMTLTELSKKVGVTISNLSILKPA